MQMHVGATTRLGALAVTLWLLTGVAMAQEPDADDETSAEPEGEVGADPDDSPPASTGTPQLQLSPRVPALDEVQEPEQAPLLPSTEDGEVNDPLATDPGVSPPIPPDRPLQLPPDGYDNVSQAQAPTAVVPTTAAPEDTTHATVGAVAGASILFTDPGFTAPDPMDPDDPLEADSLVFVRAGAYFDYRLPDVLGLVLGFGAAAVVNDQATALEIGPRVGMGFYFFDTGDVAAEGAIILMPGVFVGIDGLFVPRAYFDLYGAIEIRFEFWRALEARALAGFSQINGSGWGHFAGGLGYAF